MNEFGGGEDLHPEGCHIETLALRSQAGCLCHFACMETLALEVTGKMPVPLCLYGDVGIEVTGKMPVPLCLFGLSEALARGWVDEGVGFGVAGGFHGWAVPVDVFLETEGDDACEADFGKVAAVVEVGEDLGTAEDGVDPFFDLAFGARDGFGDGFGCGVGAEP